MFKIVSWSEDLDLSKFYENAERRGFLNNASQKMLVDCFRNEHEWQVWILYYRDIAVGSVAAHSMEDGYRICARTCVFSDLIPTPSLRTRNQIVTHQHITGQFFIPTCIEWAPKGSKFYITTNENATGSQKLVHKIFAPAMEEAGQMKRIKDMFYRGTNQTVWELYPDKFYEAFNKTSKW